MLDEIIRARRSIRKYSSKKVSFQNAIEICDVARFAPMAGNIFSLKLVIVSEKEKIKQLAEASQQPFIADASFIVVVCSETSKVARSYGMRGEKYARQQAGAAIQNMLLKITELGLASCWIGWFDDATVRRIIKAPSDADIEALLPVGYAAEKPRKIFKPDLKSIIFFEEWGKKEKK
ncbi:MAG: nitroreductase family protein [Candidatus Pacearchaeota archaeon]|nr:nitroreductase family protein [Candidatus Pacearchaeota archaeon]